MISACFVYPETDLTDYLLTESIEIICCRNKVNELQI
jgi:hypothetical protein